jgi:hypothetical protein
MPSRSAKSRKYRKQRGGDSASYGFGQAVAPGAPYASEVLAKEACLATPRPGTLFEYSAGTGGLPGFAGGSRRKRASGKRFSLKKLYNNACRLFMGKRKQRGGRWTADVAASTGGPNPFVPVTRIGCEGGSIDTSPPGAANPVLSIQNGGVGGVASAFYAAPTAGYGNEASKWTDMTGTPSMLQTPYDARTMNPACLKTGGARRSKTRKGRKAKARKGKGRK